MSPASPVVMSSDDAGCSNGHNCKNFAALQVFRFRCMECNRSVSTGSFYFTCTDCDRDICAKCYECPASRDGKQGSVPGKVSVSSDDAIIKSEVSTRPADIGVPIAISTKSPTSSPKSSTSSPKWPARTRRGSGWFASTLEVLGPIAPTPPPQFLHRVTSFRIPDTSSFQRVPAWTALEKRRVRREEKAAMAQAATASRPVVRQLVSVPEKDVHVEATINKESKDVKGIAKGSAILPWKESSKESLPTLLQSSRLSLNSVTSTRSGKECQFCGRAYSGFGTSCGDCRRRPTLPSVFQCRECHQYFTGFDDICEECQPGH